MDGKNNGYVREINQDLPIAGVKAKFDCYNPHVVSVANYQSLNLGNDVKLEL